MRRGIARLGMAAATLAFTLIGLGQASAEDRALKLYNLHTHERATIVFKRNGVYDRGGLKAINEFLRDWRKEKSTNMDPHLFDLLWQVYGKSGSSDYIQVVCGYRSPETNGMLRRRSNGVAKNSLHMQGKAMDFFIPDVPLPKLRAIGLQMQIGGVGFYPTSGSPFVHMDTGSVRHWPRMTREQLVRVFPNGNTLHVPSDGKPLPGYAQALAAYKARKSGMTADTQVASFGGSPVIKGAPAPVGKPMVIAAADQVDDEEEADEATVADAPAPKRAIGVAVASYATTTMPMPRLAPRHAQPTVIAAAEPLVPPASIPSPGPDRIALIAEASLTSPDFDFGGPQDWSAPAVPAALAAAMAERDQTRRGTSLPIAPTSVVATIDVGRPLRAEAMTTAVLRRSDDANSDNTVPRLLAYAPAVQPAEPAVHANAGGIPFPRLNPIRAASATPLRVRDVRPQRSSRAPQLTMTVLDTQGLRMWIGSLSTRQKAYAVLTMPDYRSGSSMMDKPDMAMAAGFGDAAYAGLRTDHFSGPLVRQPAVVDLRLELFRILDPLSGSGTSHHSDGRVIPSAVMYNSSSASCSWRSELSCLRMRTIVLNTLVSKPLPLASA